MTNTNTISKLEIAKNAAKAIQKAMWNVTIYNLGWNESNLLNVQRRPSGSHKLDEVLGGGYPQGRIIEVFGPESSGKTTLTLIAAANVTQNWGTVLFIDAEQALDIKYAEKIGVNLNNVFLVQPTYGEEAFDILRWAIQSKAYDLIIVDSVSALIPKAQLEGTAEDAAQIGLLARLMSRQVGNVVSDLGVNKESVVIFINQLREKIGGFSMWYGDNTETTWGRALKFYSSIRIEAKKWEPLKRGDVRIGAKVRVKTVKNKTYPPYRDCELTIMFDEEFGRYGLDSNQELLDVILESNILGSRGRYVSLIGEPIKATEIEGVKLSWSDALIEYLKSEENILQLQFLKELFAANNTSVDSIVLTRNEKWEVEEYLNFLKEKKKESK